LLIIFIPFSEFSFYDLNQFLEGETNMPIALALLDEGKVALGVLACPNLPLSSTNNLNGNSAGDQVRRPVSHKNWLWG
jgi:3'-phosphoadenosine 5'-phosphosulfate (PAPS) 3'-phosphatase